ncbi:hypothetical protein KFE25_003682 [Diacronema lutheri]|uniref:PX domain-containing protein n=1 Tax=Diacronema lutheri TaxID=2081491 RepID=A0A8J5XCH3_DIALT|nr:hypothetical protein KFE25_003682 [Diacronema lutheri]
MWLFGGGSRTSTTSAAAPASWQGASALQPSLLRLSVPSTHVARPLDNGRPFTVFDINVQYDARAWSVHHRFSEFKVLAHVLHERYASSRAIPPLPGENILSHALGDELAEQRRVALEAYLLRLVHIVPLDDDCFSAFLGLETLCPAEPEPAAGRVDVRHALPVASAPMWPAAAPDMAAAPRAPLESVAELSDAPATPPASAPATAHQEPHRVRTASRNACDAPMPFSWELVWEGEVGTLASDRRVRS